jgi:sugar-specific transcriptional regulator TrmB
MEQQPEALMLARLGLTPAQARIFAALYQSGLSTAKTISKNSKVARSDVYRVMATLEKLGVVEKIISAPCKFRAIPMHDAVLILMERRREETSKLQATAREILKRFKKSDVETTFKEDEPQFVLVPQSKAVVNRIRSAIDGTQKSLELLVSWRRLLEGVASAFTDSFEKACARNVQLRFIVENPLKGKDAERVIKFIRRNPFCQLRFVPRCPNVIMGIYDKKEITIAVDPATNLSDSPALWSNSQSLITMAQDYFDILWITAMENPEY